jgi:hypothetical protein
LKSISGSQESERYDSRKRWPRASEESQARIGEEAGVKGARGMGRIVLKIIFKRRDIAPAKQGERYRAVRYFYRESVTSH